MTFVDPREPAGAAGAREDAVVRAARRESVMAFGMWFVAMVYTLSYCYLHGYNRSVETLTFVWWFPDWVFWGIIVPWGICILLSTVFALAVMGDESLGEEIDANHAVPPPAGEEADHG